MEPGRKRTESENGDSLDSMVNGDLSLDVNVDIDMEADTLFSLDAQHAPNENASNNVAGITIKSNELELENTACTNNNYNHEDENTNNDIGLKLELTKSEVDENEPNQSTSVEVLKPNVCSVSTDVEAIANDDETIVPDAKKMKLDPSLVEEAGVKEKDGVSTNDDKLPKSSTNTLLVTDITVLEDNTPTASSKASSETEKTTRTAISVESAQVQSSPTTARATNSKTDGKKSPIVLEKSSAGKRNLDDIEITTITVEVLDLENEKHVLPTESGKALKMDKAKGKPATPEKNLEEEKERKLLEESCDKGESKDEVGEEKTTNISTTSNETGKELVEQENKELKKDTKTCQSVEETVEVKPPEEKSENVPDMTTEDKSVKEVKEAAVDREDLINAKQTENDKQESEGQKIETKQGGEQKEEGKPDPETQKTDVEIALDQKDNEINEQNKGSDVKTQELVSTALGCIGEDNIVKEILSAAVEDKTTVAECVSEALPTTPTKVELEVTPTPLLETKSEFEEIKEHTVVVSVAQEMPSVTQEATPDSNSNDQTLEMVAEVEDIPIEEEELPPTVDEVVMAEPPAATSLIGVGEVVPPGVGLVSGVVTDSLSPNAMATEDEPIGPVMVTSKLMNEEEPAGMEVDDTSQEAMDQ